MNNLPWLSKLTIKTKIFGMTGMLIGILTLCVIYAVSSINQIGDELISIAEEDILLNNVVSQITIHQLGQATNFERALRFGAEIDSNSFASKHFKEALKKFEHFTQQINKELHSGEKISERAMTLAHNDKQYQEFKHINTILKRVEKEHGNYVSHASHTFELIKQRRLHEATEYAERVEKEEDNIDHELETLLKEIEKFITTVALKTEHYEQGAASTLIIVGLISILLGSILAFLVARTIIKPIEKLQNTIKIIERDSDLTQRIDITVNDEIGVTAHAFNKMLEKFQHIVGQVNSSATQLSSAAEEFSIITQENTSGIQEQTSQTDQVATAINEMSATVLEVSRNAK